MVFFILLTHAQYQIDKLKKKLLWMVGAMKR